MYVMMWYMLLVVTIMPGRLLAQDGQHLVVAIAGTAAEIPCNISSSNPGDQLNILTWYKNGTTTAIYSRDLRTRGDGGSSASAMDRKATGRYKLKHTAEVLYLRIANIRPEDAGLYYCIPDFAETPTSRIYVYLDVIQLPEHLWVGRNKTVLASSLKASVNHQLGNLYEMDTLDLFCVAFGGKPAPTLSWWLNGSLYKNVTTPLTEKRVSTYLTYGPLGRQDHGMVITCQATNNYITMPITIDIALDMHLSAQALQVWSMNEEDGGVISIKEGKAARLQCRVIGAHPPPKVEWRINDNKIFIKNQNRSIAPQRVLLSEVELILTKELNEANITCCVDAYRRWESNLCADPLVLTVYFPPMLDVLECNEAVNGTLVVVTGTEVTINCTIEANPAVTEFQWHHLYLDTKEVLHHAEPGPLRLASVSERDAGSYVCWGKNTEGDAFSDPITLDVTYTPFCTDESIIEYGMSDGDTLNLTCEVRGNPEPDSYCWMLVNVTVNATTMTADHEYTLINTTDNTLNYTRPADVISGTVFCWGTNGVQMDTKRRPCTIHVTDETVPRSPSQCTADKDSPNHITVNCVKGHSGGSLQKFTLLVKNMDSESEITSVVNLEPHFIITEPTEERYKLVILAFNAKGESEAVTILQEDILEDTNEPTSKVPNITVLALSLFGGVAVLALAACGLVLCSSTHPPASRTHSREPALAAYNTDESNCGTCNDSDEGSECNIKRSDSFRRAVASRQSPKPHDVRRTSSFHSARYLHDLDENDGLNVCTGDIKRHGASCRVHSLQNINKKREMDAMCDHLMMHIPTDMPIYNLPKPTTSFHTMPRKMRQKLLKEFSVESAELTQNSDNFSLPPPPDEFTSYRAGTRISAKEALKQPGPIYSISRKDEADEKNPFNDVIISPMNTVGLPTLTGQSTLYNYPDDDIKNTNGRGSSCLSTFQNKYSSPRESGI